MKNILAILLLGLLCSCGVDGGDIKEADKDTNSATAPDQQPTAVPTSSMIQCSRDGDLWLCNAENSCIRDQSTPIEGAVEKGLLIRTSVSGPLTVVAECGSNVTLVIDSHDSTQTTSEQNNNTTN